MRHIAQHDALTGLPNRLALLMRLGQLLPEARRHKLTMAIMFLDLDRFKIINDTLGHQVGDELLREVACRLSKVVRETDFVARLGGDEFVVILPGITNPSDAAIVANKIIAALSSPIEAEGHELHTSPSIGISLFPDDGPDGDTILKNADTAMYHAKAAGRNNYQFFAADMNKATAERLNIERKLRHAIARNELALCFQPSSRPTARSRPRRSADPLAPPGRRHDLAAAFHPGRRGNRHHCRDRRMGVAQRLSRDEALDRRRPQADAPSPSTFPPASCAAATSAKRWRGHWPAPACRPNCWSSKSPKAR